MTEGAAAAGATHGSAPALAVSACLLGTCCNHEGRGSPSAPVERLGGTHRLVPVCPETLGGLPTPRPPAEIVGGDGADVLDRTAVVRTDSGADVTEAYLRGAQAAVAVVLAAGATRAVLKARSPSCGSSQIYDGSFARVRRAGDGVTAAALRRAGVEVVSEEEI